MLIIIIIIIVVVLDLPRPRPVSNITVTDIVYDIKRASRPRLKLSASWNRVKGRNSLSPQCCFVFYVSF